MLYPGIPGPQNADTALSRKYFDFGAQLIAVGVDTTLLVMAASELLDGFDNESEPTNQSLPPGSVY